MIKIVKYQIIQASILKLAITISLIAKAITVEDRTMLAWETGALVANKFLSRLLRLSRLQSRWFRCRKIRLKRSDSQ